MSSKLDQMRNQFRERLNLRPVSQTKIHAIKVENNDNNNNNNNNNNIDSKIAKSDTYSAKNSIPTLNKSLLTDNQKSSNYFSKVDANKYNKSNKFSVYPKNENSMKSDSKDIRQKVDFNQESAKRSSHQWMNSNKNKKPENCFQSSISADAFPERLTRKPNTEGTACRFCRRLFALSERLEKHEAVCMSSLDKSRIKFDSFEQRVKGQPNDYLLIYENALKNTPKMEQKKSNWRQKHEYCVAAIKAAKGQVSSGPTTSQILASFQQQCDYCKRRFNDEAIKRHLPICAKLYHKKLMKI